MVFAVLSALAHLWFKSLVKKEELWQSGTAEVKIHPQLNILP